VVLLSGCCMPFPMRAIFTILSILSAIHCNCQNYTQIIDNIDPWVGQVTYNYNVLIRFEEYCKKNDLLTAPRSMLEVNGEELRLYSRLVDLNNDGLQDVVYSGTSGGEPNIVHLFLQTENGFEQVFEVMQSIDKVTWKGEFLDKVFVSTPGCCADYRLINSVYEVKYNSQNRPIFTKIFQSVEIGDELIKPKNYFNNLIQFEVNNDGYKLRLAPIIDNETEFHWLEITGNTFATLKQGTRGTALASSLDETGRTWWYVEIDFNSNVQNCILTTPDQFPTKIIGWLSSRFVTEL
jgi:hypothetical protein